MRRSGAAPLFPDPAGADPSGLLACGGNLEVETLLTAYSSGIFPWYSRGEPILWWSPDPRFVLEFDRFHVPRSLAKTIRKGTYEIRADTAFSKVITRCGAKPRPGQDGTWITREMKAAYIALHESGFAHSFEAYRDGSLAGGLYGVSLGGIFFGESMYADAPDASKAALCGAVEALRSWKFDLIDCQIHSENLERFGAREIPRKEYLRRLSASLRRPTRSGPWRIPSRESPEPVCG
jgi:leucyl/phenylalanyl-tRNA--protein transferase